MFICQTPSEHCRGGRSDTSAGLRASKIKIHRTGKEANNCYGNYLTNVLGYTRVPFNSRAFTAKDGSTTLILPKRNRADFRPGKSSDKTKSGSRLQPNKRGGRSGIIIG